MKVQRIVANIETADVAAADAFYRGVLGLDVVMDHGWLRTYASDSRMRVQVSFASQGGSGTPVPDLSIEVDDLAEALRRVQASGIPSSTARSMSPGACVGSTSATRWANSSTSCSMRSHGARDAPDRTRVAGRLDSRGHCR